MRPCLKPHLKPHLKPLSEQVLVITGASSGIGLETARMAAARGAAVVLAARNEAVLRQVCEEIRAAGGRAAFAVADVAEEAQVRGIAAVAEREFGGFDTWVNNAGVVVFGELERIPLADHRRLFETNYWGVVHGTRVAREALRRRPGGGAIITLGSVTASLPAPLMGAYAATKAAVAAFIDVTRMEAREAGEPVAVTLVKPSGISTPIGEHARSHMDVQGRIAPPLYDTRIVARSLLYAAEHETREVVVGAVGRLMMLGRSLLPGLTDRVMGVVAPPLQRSGRPPRGAGNLEAPAEDGRVYREEGGPGLPASPYTALALRPVAMLGVVVLALGAGGLALAARAGRRRPGRGADGA